MLELLHMGGRSLPHAVLMMIPEAWENHQEMDAERAGLLRVPRLADGAVGRPGVRRLHRRLPDRRGARPQRPAPEPLLGHRRRPRRARLRGRACSTSTRRRIVRKGRLQPGRMFLVDTDEHRIIEDDEIKGELAAEHPYDEWLHAGLIHLDDIPEREHIVHTHASVTRRQQVFGYTQEELRDPAHADGQRRRRADRLDGHRHPDRGAQRQAPAALRLLRADVRAGHQPAAGRDPRGAGHLAGRHHRPRGQPARADAGGAAARSCCRSR